MALIVQKFGGTSVGNIERIRNVAVRVKRELDAGNHVAVVVSAMSGETNKLVGFAEQLSALDTKEALQEYDAVVAAGEQVTAGLTALALQSLGIPARSWLAWQIPFKADTAYGKARIEEINADALLAEIKSGVVAVVPGFQGVTDEGRLATLGRGGSDTSAVALAVALKADRCDIYTDVDGIYTTDPRVAPKARKLREVAYEEMLEMASQGAKVLQLRSVEMAMKYNVKLQVLSSFSDEPGSMLTDSEESIMERRLVTGVTYSAGEAQISVKGVKNVPGVAAQVFAPLADVNVNVDMIVQNVNSEQDVTDITFTVPKTDLTVALKALEEKKAELGFTGLFSRKDVAKISVIGVGMRSHAGLAQKMFATLAAKGINILIITTSEIKVSVLIQEEYTELAVRALHTAYGLDKDA